MNEDLCLTAGLYRAELDLRTGHGRYRKVMRYEYGKTYGNDLSANKTCRKNPCEAGCRCKHPNSPIYEWEEVFVAEFYEFFGRLFGCKR